MATKYIALRLGYAAESYLGTLIFTASVPHETPQEALKSLANALFTKFLRETYTRNPCCAKRKKTWQLCPECGSHFYWPSPNVDDFVVWLRVDFSTRIADQYGDEIEGWHPWDTVGTLVEAKKDEVLCIDTYGDSVIPAAIDLSQIDHDMVKNLVGEDNSWAHSISELYVPSEYHHLIPNYKDNR